MKKIFNAIWTFLKGCVTWILAGLLTTVIGVLEIALFPFLSIFMMFRPKEPKL